MKSKIETLLLMTWCLIALVLCIILFFSWIETGNWERLFVSLVGLYCSLRIIFLLDTILQTQQCQKTVNKSAALLGFTIT